MENLSGFVKMAIIGNPNIDNKTAEILCKYVEDLQDSVFVLENQYGVQAKLNAEMKKELDEHRRNACCGYSDLFSEQAEYAAWKGWDCFNEENN